MTIARATIGRAGMPAYDPGGAGAVPSTAGARPWFEPLVRAFEGPALGFAIMMVRDRSAAEEILQDAFARVWASPNTPSTAPEFRRWLYRVITNLAHDHLRRRARLARLRFWIAPAPDPLEVVDRWMEDQELVVALRQLSRREQLAIYLHYYEDRPFEEVDGVLGSRPGTGRKVVSRAVDKLRRQLPARPVTEVSV